MRDINSLFSSAPYQFQIEKEMKEKYPIEDSLKDKDFYRTKKILFEAWDFWKNKDMLIDAKYSLNQVSGRKNFDDFFLCYWNEINKVDRNLREKYCDICKEMDITDQNKMYIDHILKDY